MYLLSLFINSWVRNSLLIIQISYYILFNEISWITKLESKKQMQFRKESVRSSWLNETWNEENLCFFNICHTDVTVAWQRHSICTKVIHWILAIVSKTAFIRSDAASLIFTTMKLFASWIKFTEIRWWNKFLFIYGKRILTIIFSFIH